MSPSVLTNSSPRHLISLSPASSFLDPSHSPNISLQSRLQDANHEQSVSLSAPRCASILDASPSADSEVDSEGLRTYYVAGRSHADLVNILDLALPPVESSIAVDIPGPPQSPIGPSPASPQSTRDRHISAASPPAVVKAIMFNEVNNSISNPPLTMRDFPSPPLRPPRPAVSPLDIVDIVDKDDIDVVEQLQTQSAFINSPHREQLERLVRSKDVRGSPPAHDESFWRWSRSTSDIPYESAPPSTIPGLIEKERTPDANANDKSFLRLTRTTIFSDFSAPSTVPDVPDISTLPAMFRRKASDHRQGSLLGAIPEASVIMHTQLPSSHTDLHAQGHDAGEKAESKRKTEDRFSAGTFGPLNRRWSAIGSSSSRSADISFGDHGDMAPRSGAVRTDNDVGESNGHHRRHRRALSFSSASDSTYTGSAYSGDRALDDTALAARRAIGLFPSPVLGRLNRRQPETEQAIDAHLLRQAANNERRIIPSERSEAVAATLELPIDLAPPPHSSLEQVHPEVSNVTDDHVPISPGPPPPFRGHRPAAPLSPNRTAPPPESDHADRKSHQHTLSSRPPPKTSDFYQHELIIPMNYTSLHHRSTSMDSLPSLHPSVSESINTLSRLIPTSPTAKRVPYIPSSALPAVDLTARNDLTAEQRAVLIKRTRKLERMLGEALPERHVERLLVEPANNNTVAGSLPRQESRSVIPAPPIGRGHVAVEREHGPRASQAGRSNTSLVRTGSNIARKAKAAFGFDKPEMKQLYPGSDELQQESVTPLQQASRRHGLSTPRRPSDPKSSMESIPATPTSVHDKCWPSSEINDNEGDEVSRRNRRQQLTKLHRILGAPIPPELLHAPVLEATQTVNDPYSMRAPSPSEQSYLSLDDETPNPSYIQGSGLSSSKWTSKLRETLNNKRKGNPALTHSSHFSTSQIPESASFMDLGPDPPRALSSAEKQLARKRAAKLEQVLGDRPPTQLYIYQSIIPSPSSNSRISTGTRSTAPSPSIAGLSSSDRNESRDSDAFEAYSQGLEGLLYLADNDRAHLATIIDSFSPSIKGEGTTPLDGPHRPTTTSRRSLYTSQEQERGDEPVDPHSHSARRRRTGKLSQFFGESVDLSYPPDDLPPSRLTPNTTSSGLGSQLRARRETMDALLGEMWRSVQAEVRGRGLKLDEVDRLGDLMGVLKERERVKGRNWEMI